MRNLTEGLTGAQNALRTYGIPSSEAKINPLSKGHVTQKWICITRTKSFVLKELPKGTTFHRALFISSLQHHLGNTQAYAPALVSNSDGTLFTTYSGSHYLLMEYWHSTQEFSEVLSPKQCYDVGSFLGELHSLFRNLKPQGDAIGLKIPEEPLVALERIMKDNAAVKSSPFFRDALMVKHRLLQKLLEMWEPQISQYPIQIIHGDFYPGNLILSNRFTIRGIVDFDQSGAFYRCYEFMRALLMTVAVPLPSSFGGPVRARAEPFIAGYRQHTQLNEFELHGMLQLYLWVLAGDLCGLNRLSKEEDLLQIQPFFSFRLALANWLDSVSSEMSSMLMSQLK